MTTAMLEGVTVLDLASGGPAARASRWLADYGATVVKVGPVPARDGVQITPPFHAYSAHREMRRALVDLKAPEGREVFLRLADAADVVLESYRPGVV
ncbi:MAG TPA: CoA transferase, partial [Acidimicrobiia bacterium]